MVENLLAFNGNVVGKGQLIEISQGKPIVPDRPVIPFIAGDGIGQEITNAMREVVNRAVGVTYGRKRKIAWLETYAGEKAMEIFGSALPLDTLKAIELFRVAIKGPLNTPTGQGLRSLNVALRSHFDLYQCVRPLRHFVGVPSPMVRPQDLNVVIFRENTEDVYAGIEYQQCSDKALQLAAFLEKLGETIRPDSGIGIKIISREGSRRLVRSALQYAVNHKLSSVTLVHKGNIQKFTEGAFLRWGEELAQEEFADYIVSESELWRKHDGVLPEGKIVLRSRIADAMFAELLLRPTNHSVIASCNLNGDYLSDAAAGQVGGLGMAPGANIGDNYAIFEATHGTAPDIAGKNIANPSSLILSAVMMLDFMGWKEAAELIVEALAATIADGHLTKDLAVQAGVAQHLSTTEFAAALVKTVRRLARKKRMK